jgi:Flp pilus assembly pilin Flp
MLSKLLRQTRRLASDSRAAANIEYALIAVLIGIGSLAALTAMADSVIGIWTEVEGEFVESISGAAGEEAEGSGLNLGNITSKKNKGRGQGKTKEKKEKKPNS